MKKLIRSTIDKVTLRALQTVRSEPLIERGLALHGAMSARQLRSIKSVRTLADVEFSVFSQWGEDGIIEWIIQQLVDIPQTFIEFGVETYKESNTRFLLINRNWRGLIIDGSPENIEVVKRDSIYWRHDILATAAFITTENINELISIRGFDPEVGILSVDIDGNDYWVWKAITEIRPWIVITEYNATFGDRFAITIPYSPDFQRSAAHWSTLYYGASVSAMQQLADSKGYTLIGSNLAGGNAFFVRDDLLGSFKGKIEDLDARASRFRESRAKSGNLTYVSGLAKIAEISSMEVVLLDRGATCKLSELGELYSEKWKRMMDR